MPKRKHEAPTVTTYADHEIITPPHPLKKAVARTSSDDDDPVARAEKALAELSTEFPGWMDVEIERLDAARYAIHGADFDPKTREALFHSAHDIKGQAPTFGYPAVAAVANSLCRLIEHTPDLQRIPLSLVDQHVDAIRAIVRESPHGEMTQIAASLTRRLREVTDEFLVRENKHRPDYLDGIVAPPLAPKE